MKRTPKPKPYLVTATCIETIPEVHRAATTPARTLTHTLYRTTREVAATFAETKARWIGEAFEKQMADTHRTAIGPVTVTVAPKLYRKHKSAVPRGGPSAERQAENYARWLAARDGIKLPGDGRVTAIWSGVNSKTRTRKWGGAVWEKRIRAVAFGGIVVPIPNWDWQPDPPVEETDDDLRRAA